ncbi:MAG: agmatinase [Candidatus Hodarchaeales archaeon]
MNTRDFFGAAVNSPSIANLIVMGIPWDKSSSYRKGASKAPSFIRQATSSKLYNPYAETGVNLVERWQIHDAGDILLPDNAEKARDKILGEVARLNNQLDLNLTKFLFLGGDHLITFFSFHALAHEGVIDAEKCGIIYLDAHPDLYDDLEGNKYSHACVLRRIIDQTDINPVNIVQIGIRAPTPQQLDYAGETGINIITTAKFLQKGPLGTAKLVHNILNKNVKEVYLSIDLDVLDPSFAPGIGNPQPGGISSREIIDFIHGLAELNISAFDVVEYCPEYDSSMITACAAAKIIQEVLGIMK